MKGYESTKNRYGILPSVEGIPQLKSPKTVGLSAVSRNETPQLSYDKGPLKKRCRLLPAGGLGVPPKIKSPPRLGD
jgi:hypothetical protein